jgi:hypothetical protein
MNTAPKTITLKPLDRRRFIKLAAASILVVAGCTNVRQESDLEATMTELNRVLDDMDDKQQERVASIAQRIQVRASELAGEHRTFTDSLDRLLTAYDTTDSQLQQLIDTYNRRRMQMRNELLHLQDELHVAMTPDDWSEVVHVLNRAGKSLAGYTLSGN